MSLSDREFRDLERTLGKLDDCVELSDWDREFVEDMCKRVIDYGKDVRITGKQSAQIERMKEQYL